MVEATKELREDLFRVISGFSGDSEIIMFDRNGERIFSPENATRFALPDRDILVNLVADTGDVVIQSEDRSKISENERLIREIRKLANGYGKSLFISVPQELGESKDMKRSEAVERLKDILLKLYRYTGGGNLPKIKDKELTREAERILRNQITRNLKAKKVKARTSFPEDPRLDYYQRMWEYYSTIAQVLPSEDDILSNLAARMADYYFSLITGHKTPFEGNTSAFRALEKLLDRVARLIGVEKPEKPAELDESDLKEWIESFRTENIFLREAIGKAMIESYIDTYVENMRSWMGERECMACEEKKREIRELLTRLAYLLGVGDEFGARKAIDDKRVSPDDMNMVTDLARDMYNSPLSEKIIDFIGGILMEKRTRKSAITGRGREQVLFGRIERRKIDPRTIALDKAKSYIEQDIEPREAVKRAGLPWSETVRRELKPYIDAYEKRHDKYAKLAAKYGINEDHEDVRGCDCPNEIGGKHYLNYIPRNVSQLVKGLEENLGYGAAEKFKKIMVEKMPLEYVEPATLKLFVHYCEDVGEDTVASELRNFLACCGERMHHHVDREDISGEDERDRNEYSSGVPY